MPVLIGLNDLLSQIGAVSLKDIFWNGSYFIASCGGVTVSTLRKYIENQNSPESGDSSSTHCAVNHAD